MSETTGPHNFVSSEESVLDFWKKENIFQKSLEATKDLPPYIFYDGPPFATGLPHHGHLVGSTLKDIVPRYWTMKGRHVDRRFGWDCHGLPIEQEIDKKLNMSAQDAVKKLGVKAYNDECRGIVQRYTQEWEKTISRLGRWVDFENDYKTMDTSFMESVWWAFKQLWDKNLIYQGTKVVPVSTKLGTVLSNFEATSNYQDVQDPAITVLFKLKKQLGDRPTFMAAWTTTPWTLPANLGLCVGPEIEYVLIHDEDKDRDLVMASALWENFSKKHQLSEVKTLKASELAGLEYIPLFDYYGDLSAQGAFRVQVDDYVSTDSGTGVVHLAPDFGEDDDRVLNKVGKLDLHACPVDDFGVYTEEVRDMAGTYVKDADKEVIQRLKDQNLLFHQDVIVHAYPYCWRTDTPLIYKAIPSWYVKVEAIKEKLKKSNSNINWVPGHIKEGRFGKWLEGARDWSISRMRVWGTPLPIWINDVSGKAICVGSIEELKNYTGVTLDDLHRENVDPLTFQVKGEEGTYQRIEEVLDCWFESGSMPYAQIHYPFENKDLFEQGFPAEFIAEGLDQTRGWFYTLNVLSSALFERQAFKNVIVNGIVMAADGKKMSKRLRNYTPPDELMETYGADALRLYLITSGLTKGEEQRFTDDGVKDMARRALLPWFNAFKFLVTYAQVDQWDPKADYQSSDNIVDRWILAKLQTLKSKVQNEMEVYKLYNVVPALFDFIEELTNWYIRLNRSRFWSEDAKDADKMKAYSTLYTAVSELSLVMAPFAPFLSEHIYLELQKLGTGAHLPKQSVHLCEYPVADETLMNPELEQAMARMEQIILLGRQKRNQEKIKVKTPLSCLTVIHRDQHLLDEIKKLEAYIQTELNVKQVNYSVNEEQYINLFARPNFKVLGKKVGKEMKRLSAAIQKLDMDQILAFEDTGAIKIEEFDLIKEDLQVFREPKDNSQAISNRLITIDLDCDLGQDLIEEGLAREIVSRIQKARKEAQFKITDRIEIGLFADEALGKAVNAHQDYLSRETLTENLSVLENDQIPSSFDHGPFHWEIDGHKMVVGLKLFPGS